ncbi:MAG: 30S ribosomal protein S9, partial [Phenylobacterium sp.]|nr:30S ribosomal protein S9 [Phenylobacterium sp.]
MLGRMQDWPLTVDRILDHAKAWHGDREIVTRSVEGPIVRTTYAEVHKRAKRISNALRAMGIQPGDRVATLACVVVSVAGSGLSGQAGAIRHGISKALT